MIAKIGSKIIQHKTDNKNNNKNDNIKIVTKKYTRKYNTRNDFFINKKNSQKDNRHKKFDQNNKKFFN